VLLSLWFLARIAEELQLLVIGRRSVATAKGVAELDECLGVVEVMGRKAYTHILVSDDIDTVLIGAVTLETLGFEVDPVTGRAERRLRHTCSKPEDAQGKHFSC